MWPKDKSTFAVELVLVGIITVVVIAFLMPQNDDGTLGQRSVCSNNLRQIVTSFALYAQNNHAQYPTVMPPAPAPAPARETFLLNNPNPRPVNAATALQLRRLYFPRGHAAGLQHGSPTACLWLLVADGQLTPKNFICPEDPYTNAPADLYAAAGARRQIFDNFGGGAAPGDGESYSIACPWLGQKNAPWWTGNGDNGSDVVLASDMAPAATGTNPKSDRFRNPAVPEKPPPQFVTPNVWNSGNHDGDGQNVAFGDTHVSWKSTPFCGDDGDNIFSTDKFNPQPPASPTRAPSLHHGIMTVRWSRRGPGKRNHFDTVMAPVQDILQTHTAGGFDH